MFLSYFSLRLIITHAAYAFMHDNFSSFSTSFTFYFLYWPYVVHVPWGHRLQNLCNHGTGCFPILPKILAHFGFIFVQNIDRQQQQPPSKSISTFVSVPSITFFFSFIFYVANFFLIGRAFVGVLHLLPLREIIFNSNGAQMPSAVFVLVSSPSIKRHENFPVNYSFNRKTAKTDRARERKFIN